MVRCLLGTGVRLLNWALAASAGVSAMCLAFGVSRNVLVCRLFEARQGPSQCRACVVQRLISPRGVWIMHPPHKQHSEVLH